MKTILIRTLLLTNLMSSAFAHSKAAGIDTGKTPDRPDGHAPISIMGDHTHAKGEWMLSFRTMRMDMDGMRNGEDRVSSAEVFTSDGGYTVTPTEMTMDMHMFGLMYAPTDKITLMLMASYLDIEMDHQINPNVGPLITANQGSDTFRTEADGLGDIQLVSLIDLFEGERSKVHAGLGISLPTGSIDEEDNTPLPGMPPTFPVQQLPASMQLGSGTFDLLPSITFRSAYENWSYGAQAKATLRLEDENDNGYRLGNVIELTGWGAYNLTDWIGLNGGLSYRNTGELRGEQADVGQMGPAGRSVTTAFGENYGGERLDCIIGVNLLGQHGLIKGHRIAIDLRLPLWQDLNGFQLETDSVLTIGWQKAF